VNRLRDIFFFPAQALSLATGGVARSGAVEWVVAGVFWLAVAWGVRKALK
jgi:hypothetical protein